jgi:hypothetical protein
MSSKNDIFNLVSEQAIRGGLWLRNKIDKVEQWQESKRDFATFSFMQ